MKFFTKYIWILISLPVLLFACSDGTTLEGRYAEETFTDITITRDIEYGSNTNQSGATEVLKMDIFEPANDVLDKRPLIILAHGGGFVFGTRTDMDFMAEYFAKAGYVVASISYRLVDVELTGITYPIGVINAIHDMKASIRYFRKDAASDNVYRIDPDKIIVGGISAGAVMATHSGYLQTSAELSAINLVFGGLLEGLGGAEGNSGNPGFSSEVVGVVNISGAILSSDFLTPNEPYIISVHGTEDDVIAYESGDANNSGISLEGSKLIHDKAETVSITNQLITRTGEGHDAFFNCDDCMSQIRTFLAGQVIE